MEQRLGCDLLQSLMTKSLLGSRLNVSITRRLNSNVVANWVFTVEATSCPRAFFADDANFAVTFVVFFV